MLADIHFALIGFLFIALPPFWMIADICFVLILILLITCTSFSYLLSFQFIPKSVKKVKKEKKR
jgi:hypothetical protein